MNVTGRQWQIAELRKSVRFWEDCGKIAYSKRLKTEERLCLRHAQAQKKIMDFLKGKNQEAREGKA